MYTQDNNDYVVVDENNGVNAQSSAALSEFEQINPSDVQSSVEIPPPTIPPPAPQNPYQDEDEYEYDEYDKDPVVDQVVNEEQVVAIPPPVPTQEEEEVVVIPPPVPSQLPQNETPAIETPPDEVAINYEMEEQKTLDIANRMSMDEVKLNDNIVPTTGNILEDLDNLLRIYKNLPNEKERELVYNEFWDKYNKVAVNNAYLLLEIPTRVRGFLDIMQDGMEPYRRDRIMIHVLSRNGLLEEPEYIRNRYLFTYFIQNEIFNYFGWFAQNCSGIQAWMWFLLWTLMLAEFVQVGIAFGRGNPWRAILMECNLALTFIASMQFVDTPYTQNILRTLIENNCAALCTINGRVSLNILIIFFCLGSIELQDAFLLFAAFLCALWTAIIFISFSRLKHASNYVRIATGTTKKLLEKFKFADEDKDGILSPVELRNFFKSYNQIVPMWQIELMIAQYDIHRDGGLRFDGLRLWFEKIPINHITRINALNAKPYDLKSNGDNTNNNNIGDGYRTSNNNIPTTTSGGGGGAVDKNQFTEAEREWLGLAGRKYMNQ